MHYHGIKLYSSDIKRPRNAEVYARVSQYSQAGCTRIKRETVLNKAIGVCDVSYPLVTKKLINETSSTAFHNWPML